MNENNGPYGPRGLILEYKLLGTISIDEFAHAVWEDVQVLKDLYNVRYIKSGRLKVLVTDEYGDEIKVRRPGGGYVHYLHTCHYRPACKDYGL